MALLDMKNITKSFRMADQTIHILNGISFSVNRGDFLSITGPSGSGKSTLMHLIGCLDLPTSGTYLIEGKDVSQMTSDELAKIRNNHIGFVFQKFHLLDDLKAIDNVALPQLYASNTEKGAQQEAKKILELVNLSDRLYYYPNQLSGGQQQRVAIARALVNNPDIILADEPTGNLDTATGKTIMNIFEHLNKEHGVTIIVVTHDLELAQKMNRMIKLRDGQIVEDVKLKAL
jgi:ABC-type antimicrobial peptide transport system, ATPase component